MRESAFEKRPQNLCGLFVLLVAFMISEPGQGSFCGLTLRQLARFDCVGSHGADETRVKDLAVGWPLRGIKKPLRKAAFLFTTCYVFPLASVVLLAVVHGVRGADVRALAALRWAAQRIWLCWDRFAPIPGRLLPMRD